MWKPIPLLASFASIIVFTPAPTSDAQLTKPEPITVVPVTCRESIALELKNQGSLHYFNPRILTELARNATANTLITTSNEILLEMVPLEGMELFVTRANIAIERSKKDGFCIREIRAGI